MSPSSSSSNTPTPNTINPNTSANGFGFGNNVTVMMPGVEYSTSPFLAYEDQHQQQQPQQEYHREEDLIEEEEAGEDDMYEDLEEKALQLALEETYAETGWRYRPWGRNAKSIRMGKLVMITNLVAANSGSVVIPHSSSSAGSGGGDYDLVPISPIHCSIQPGLLSSAGSFGGAGLSLSFGSRFYPGISPGQVINSLECVLLLCQVFALIVLILLFIVLNNDSPNEFKCRLSSSVESDHGSLIRALSGDFGCIREDEFVRLFFYFLLIC